MSIGIIIALIVLGVFLLLVEFLIVPGVTVAGIAGSIFIVGGVVLGYHYHETPTSHYILIGTVFLLIGVFALAFKTKTWQKLGLKTSIESHATEDVATLFKVGDTGKSVSRLAPIGKILVNETLVEARSLGGYIDPGIEVEIIRTEKNKLFVEPKQKK